MSGARGVRRRVVGAAMALVRAVAGIGLSVGLSLAATARAQTPARPPVVLLFSAPEAEPLAGRIEAELASAGLVPRRAPAPAAAELDELVAITATARADGGVRVGSDGASAEMWILDAQTGRTLLRQSLVADRSTAMASVIALRTVEFLRASLLPVPAPPPPAPARPPESVVPVVRPTGARLTLSLAPAYVVSVGGVGGGLSTAVLVAIHPRRWFGLEGVALVPVSAGELDTREGSTRVKVYLAGAGARARWPADGAWSANVGVGALAALVRATGAASPGLVGTTDELWGAAAYARAGGTVALLSWLSLRADVMVGALAPRAIFQLAGRDAASWGRPFSVALLGLEVRVL